MKEFGQLLVALGALAWLPSLVDREWILSAWLGDLQAPVGISAMVVGAGVWGAAKLREYRNAGPVAPPTGATAQTPNRTDEGDT